MNDLKINNENSKSNLIDVWQKVIKNFPKDSLKPLLNQKACLIALDIENSQSIVTVKNHSLFALLQKSIDSLDSTFTKVCESEIKTTLQLDLQQQIQIETRNLIDTQINPKRRIMLNDYEIITTLFSFSLMARNCHDLESLDLLTIGFYICQLERMINLINRYKKIKNIGLYTQNLIVKTEPELIECFKSLSSYFLENS